MLLNIGGAQGMLGECEEAVSCYQQVLLLEERARSAPMRIECLDRLARAFQLLGRLRDALNAGVEELELCLAGGAAELVARARTTVGSIHLARGEAARALEVLDPVPSLLEASAVPADRKVLAQALTYLGCARAATGDVPGGIALIERGAAQFQALGDARSVAWNHLQRGDVLAESGDPDGAGRSYELGRDASERARDVPGQVAALVDLCALQRRGRDYVRAIGSVRAARALVEGGTDRSALGALLAEEGEVERLLGDYVAAQDLEDRAFDLTAKPGLCPAVRARVALLRGNLHFSLGDGPRAASEYERALALARDFDDPPATANALSNLGAAYVLTHEYERAMKAQLEALRILEGGGGDRSAVARSQINVADLEIQRHEPDQALPHLAKAQRGMSRLKDRRGEAEVRVTLGEAHLALGDPKAALEHFRWAADRAESLGAHDVRVHALLGEARGQLALGSPRDALASAKLALPSVETLCRGPSDEASAAVRSLYADLFDVGALAAALADDATELARFLERGRCRALLEALGGRDVLQSVTLPRESQEALRTARAAEAAAQVAYERAYEDGVRAEQKRSLALLQAAHARVAELSVRIEHERRTSHPLYCPRASTLSDLQALLRADDALVLYALLEGQDLAVALVVLGDGARVVRLGPASAIRDACERFQPSSRQPERDGANESQRALVDLVAAPLALPSTVRRVLVSPDGALSRVPFAMVFEGKDVAYEPSGTTYAWLREDPAKPGEKVLAIADPDYRAPRPLECAAGRAAGPPELWPLPGTRLEAEAIADAPPLLGSHATESELRKALALRPRWRSVLFGCHGLVDLEHPMRSSLALTSDAQDDGYLTVGDILLTRIQADLVFLAACQTGRGRVVRGEGILGLVRAFTFAGSPRVVASLWDVDDAATHAFVVKFYERWNAGRPPAAALREAQEFVRGQDRWKHPAYWAAWVLWGLPD